MVDDRFGQPPGQIGFTPVNRARVKSVLAAVLGTAIIAVVSGCGGAASDEELKDGRQLFQANCGTCHALKEAGTTAVVGPDLDASFAAARATGMDNDTIEGVVSAQIAEPRETDQDNPTYMPPRLLEGPEADAVAAYVGSVAGVPNIAPPTAPGGPGGQVFANNGCTSCHTLGVAQSAGNVGPNLDDVLPGQSPDMIRTSIVDPAAQIEAGFPNVMPSTYEQTIPAPDLDKLVNFLSTCAGLDLPANGAEPDFSEDGSCPGGATGGSSGSSSGGKGK
jgi:mono/diheme cytochrome c family protein